MTALEYDTFTEARQNLSKVIDAAREGRPVIMRRDDTSTAVLDAARLQHLLASALPSRAVIVAEGGGYSVFLPDKPVGADGSTLDEALGAMIAALRDYADAWHEVLRNAPNHRDNWGLVQLVGLSSDSQLRSWLTGES